MISLRKLYLWGMATGSLLTIAVDELSQDRVWSAAFNAALAIGAIVWMMTTTRPLRQS